MSLSTATNQATLRVELTFSEKTRRRRQKGRHLQVPTAGRRARPSDVAAALGDLGWICGITTPLRWSVERRVDGVRDVERYEPRLVLARFESPLLMVAEAPLDMVATAGKILLLLYFAKRVWKLPIEFQTHDVDVQRRLVDAESKLLSAEARRDEALRRRRHSIASLRGSTEADDREEKRALIEAGVEQEFSGIEDSFEWPKGVIAEIEQRRRSQWRGDSAIWTDEREDV